MYPSTWMSLASLTFRFFSDGKGRICKGDAGIDWLDKFYWRVSGSRKFNSGGHSNHLGHNAYSFRLSDKLENEKVQTWTSWGPGISMNVEIKRWHTHNVTQDLWYKHLTLSCFFCWFPFFAFWEIEAACINPTIAISKASGHFSNPTAVFRNIQRKTLLILAFRQLTSSAALSTPIQQFFEIQLCKWREESFKPDKALMNGIQHV